jgi:glyoxylase-like metal-dependent hydrolase (beta-lactamase superfamily II)
MTGAGNWTYLVHGAKPILIDAGVGHAGHLTAIAEAAPEGPQGVVVTHAHPDHASGARAISHRWPDTRLAKYPWPERDAMFHPAWQPLHDGDRIDTGDAELQIVHTPGHAPDHVAVWHEPSRTLFAGDLLVLGSTVVILASSGGDLLDYLQSLRKVLALAPARVLPAHGDPIEDAPALVHQYLEHRAQRERQVLTALDEGRGTIDAIVEVIYRDLGRQFVPMAKESALAHLQKLERERRVSRSGDRWSLANE